MIIDPRLEAPEIANAEASLAETPRHTAILILGMHRSGTSAFARVVNLLGAALPQHLMPAVAGNNEKGFWESTAISEINDTVLAAFGSKWDDWRPLNAQWEQVPGLPNLRAAASEVLKGEFGDAGLFVLKDPRICRLLPFWRSVFEMDNIDVRVIIPIRNPLEVAASLQLRDGFPAPKSQLLWIAHVLDAERYSRSLPRAFASYEGLLLDWRGTMQRVQKEIYLSWPQWTRDCEVEIDAFLSRGDRHHVSPDSSTLEGPDLAPWVKSAYAAVCAFMEGDTEDGALARLDQLWDQFYAASLTIGPAVQADERFRDEAVAALRSAEGHRAHLEHEVAGLQALVLHHEQHVGELKGFLGAKEQALFRASAQLVSEQQQVRRLSTLLGDKEGEIERLGEQFDASRVESAQAEHQVRLLRKRLATLTGQLATLEAQRTVISSRLNSIQKGVGWQLARAGTAVESRAPLIVRAVAATPRVFWWVLSLQVTQRLKVREQVRKILASGLFDEEWYVRNYPEILLTGLHPALEWLLHGWRAGRNPHPLFDCTWYRNANPGVGNPEVNPLLHYLEKGGASGFEPHPLFLTPWYLDRRNPSREVVGTPLEDFLRLAPNQTSTHPLFDPAWYTRQRGDIGAKSPIVDYLENPSSPFSPHPLFDNAWYLERYPDVITTGLSPLAHFVAVGASERRDPHPAFQTDWYLKQNPDVADAGGNPLVQYLLWGGWEGRDPNPFFDSDWYLHQHPEVVAGRVNPLIHYLNQGADDSFAPCPNFVAHGLDVSPSEDGTRHRTPLEVSLMRVAARVQVPAPKARISDQAMTAWRREQDLLAETYRAYLEAASRAPNGEYFVPDDLGCELSIESTIRAIAFYLPQFHPIPENDEWWGRGFTEWTNVSKAVPQFSGHYQPHLPGELGFYDLRVPEVQRRQAELAQQYGLAGFCYHYYWFAGRRLLERPLEQMLSDPAITLPFCICWANENWTRRWDGQEQDILLAQAHTPETDTAFIDDVLPLFRDPRYIRVNGQPVLIIYRVDLLPDAPGTAKRWREQCRRRGESEPYLVAAQTFGTSDPRPYGFDAAVEFPPHNQPAVEITGHVSLLNPSYGGHIYSYRSILETFSASDQVDYTRFRCVMPSWDNEARKPGQGNVYAGASPRLYGEWLQRVCAETATRETPDERLVFINAWNEWAEGAHLEPDRRYGYAYLRVTGETLRRFPRGSQTLRTPALSWSLRGSADRAAKVAVVAHIFDFSIWPEIREAMAHIPEPFDLFVTGSDRGTVDHVTDDAASLASRVLSATVPNQGRDIAPFIATLKNLCAHDYEIALKIHSKGTSTRSDGGDWRKDMFDKTLGSEAVVTAICRAFRRDSNVAMVVPSGHLLPIEYFWGRSPEADFNLEQFENVAQRVGTPRCTHGFSFAAGSVYWFRPAALAPLAALALRFEDFGTENGQVDGTFAHAMERFIGLLASTDGWQIRTTGDVNNGESRTEWLGRHIYPFACATRHGEIWDQPLVGLR